MEIDYQNIDSLRKFLSIYDLRFILVTPNLSCKENIPNTEFNISLLDCLQYQGLGSFLAGHEYNKFCGIAKNLNYNSNLYLAFRYDIAENKNRIYVLCINSNALLLYWCDIECIFANDNKFKGFPYAIKHDLKFWGLDYNNSLHRGYIAGLNQGKNVCYNATIQDKAYKIDFVKLSLVNLLDDRLVNFIRTRMVTPAPKCTLI